jgi:prolyl-tRNA synthetase
MSPNLNQLRIYLVKMKQSHFFSKTSKEASKDDVSINARLLEQGGFVQKTMSGVYTFLPLGLRVLSKIENIIREEMNAIGGQEILMPAMQPKENWVTTDRWDTMDVLFKVKSEHGYELALGPTHEEIVTPLGKSVISSYRDLPLVVYQIQTKFRDEARAKSGLLRGREFRMKDLYSFHESEVDLAKYYKVVAASYKKIFERLGIPALYVEASGGSFTKYSHEFQVELESGEDTIYICNNCSLAKNKEVYEDGVSCTDCGKSDYRETSASEVGNIFELKTRFSEAFGLEYNTREAGKTELVQMGCYGIGPSRCMGVIAEKHYDDKGIIWPDSIAPFRVHLISLTGKGNTDVLEASDKLYADLQKAGVEVLYDDREDISAGEKFADSDLIGIPNRIVVSAKTLAEASVELKKRAQSESSLIHIVDVISTLK